MKGFIDRNLVDTRYASREIYNLLKAFFAHHQIDTKVKVINGSATHYFRSELIYLKIEKKHMLIMHKML